MGVEGIGASVVRKEDKRFITGRGKYVDDIKLVGMTHAHFVRSPHAHARIRKIDASKAKIDGMADVSRSLEGRAAGVDDSGRLLLDTDAGRIPILAGDVSLRVKA